MRVGTGIDFHRFSPGRKLVLGGIVVPSDVGLVGHSDADALLHAICDALLGAAGLGDIGQHFPDTDPAYKDISSSMLLSRVRDKLQARGFRVHNVDATIIAERPKLAPYIPRMRAKIAETLSINVDMVNVKATTAEGLGALGRAEGIAAQAVASLEPDT